MSMFGTKPSPNVFSVTDAPLCLSVKLFHCKQKQRHSEARAWLISSYKTASLSADSRGLLNRNNWLARQ